MVDELAEILHVSAHTVRRDIKALCAQGKLRRLHGGVEFVEGSSNLRYSARTSLNVAAKQRIAAHLAQLIPDHATLFFSIGTTPAVVAAALAQREGLTVITNNLNAAMALSEAPGARIIIPGGELRLPDRDVLGRGPSLRRPQARCSGATVTGDGVEIERKFLVAAPDLATAIQVVVRQGYLTRPEDSVEMRLRQKGEALILTFKSGSGRVREEGEITLDRAQFDTFWPTTEGRRIEKPRWTGQLPDGNMFELDFFEGAHALLRLVEVEIPTPAAADAVVPRTGSGPR